MSKKIMINGGHGGTDSGAISGNRKEKDYTLRLTNALTVLAKGNGYNVLNNRTTDTNRNINTDAKTANNNKVDLVVELHLNSNSGVAASGTEVLYYPTSNEGKELASKMSSNIASVLGLKNRGAKGRSDLGILKQTNMVAVLVEVCFINNDSDMNALENNINGVCNAIMQSINQYFNLSINVALDENKNNISNVPNDTQTVNVTYMASTVAHGWLPEVNNLDDYVGYKNSSITNVAIKVDKGSVKYRVHVKGGNWLPSVTGYNTSDHINGYAGNGKEIDMIKIYYNTPSEIAQTGVYKRAKYRVMPTNKESYYDWQYDIETGNGQDGYAGAKDVSISRLEIIIE